MEARLGDRDTLSPTCTFTFFDCLAGSKEDTCKITPHTGVEREMRIMYQQPHLVPPMKLTVFDALPSTPTLPPPSQVSQWVSQGRNLASRASQRASLSVRRKTASRPQISGPIQGRADDLPLRRARDWRPLELSIYMPSNRLSDLPEFDRLSFTEIGEIKFPPRALLRAKSEEILQTTLPSQPDPRKPVSMFEERRRSHLRHNTSSSIVSTSRPPSEHDALHSHPVSWASLPGLPPQVHMTTRPENSIKVLTPMQEEFTPPATSKTIEDMILDFPKIERTAEDESSQGQTFAMEDKPAPSPHIGVGPNHSPEEIRVNSPPSNASYFHANYQTQKRISMWLANRSHSSSISTMKSTSTSSSFAEHRRKRSQFYQMSMAQNVPPPQPIQIHPPQHHRTMTASTVASTINTEIMSFENLSQSQLSMTTAPTELMQSRSGTIKSIGPVNYSGPGVKPIIKSTPDMPIQQFDNVVYDERPSYENETIIVGMTHHPAVGVAM